MRLPNQAASVARAPLAAAPADGARIMPANVLQWLCRFYNFPWCRPAEPCYYTHTDTRCWGVVLMCKHRGWTASGKACSGSWHACGVCFGLPF